MRKLFARALLLALVLAIAPPASQLELVSIPEVVTEEVAVSVSSDALVLSSTGAAAPDAHRSDPIAAPIPFTMIGFRMPDGVDTMQVRAADDDLVWSEWYEVERNSVEKGPDAGSEEAEGDRSRLYSEPLFVGESVRFQIEVPAEELAAAGGDVEVSATVLDTDGLSGGPVSHQMTTVTGPVAEAAGTPNIITRSQWGAAAYKGTPNYYDNVDLVVVHHTAGSNNYAPSQSAGIVRGIQRYHQQSNGWSDIGYNMILDRYGNLYEGRAGGIGRGVIGAHASSFNVGSFGISVMGNFNDVDAPQAAYETMADMIAWKAAIHGFDPLGTTDRTAKGAYVRTITGHRNVGSSSCPGRIGDRLWWLRLEAAERAPMMPATGPGPAPTNQRFADVPVSSTHHDNVITVHDTSVLLGYTSTSPDTFKPLAALNRGDMARAVAVALGLEPVPQAEWKGRFSDLDDVPWLAGYIVALVDEGVLSGYKDGTFRPKRALQRDQMATYLTNALELPRTAPTFSDIGPANTHYLAVGAIQRAGIGLGTSTSPGGQYHPLGTMRREQAASLLVRAFGLEPPPPPEPEPEDPQAEEPLGPGFESSPDDTDGSDPDAESTDSGSGSESTDSGSGSATLD